MKRLYYDRGLSFNEIATLTGIPRYRISDLFKSYNLPKRKHQVYISKAKLADLYYEQDFTLHEIARILDMSYDSVLKYMKEHNLPRRDKTMFTPAYNKAKAFRSNLRKKFRSNPCYIDIARKVLKKADENPELPLEHVQDN